MMSVKSTVGSELLNQINPCKLPLEEPKRHLWMDLNGGSGILARALWSRRSRSCKEKVGRKEGRENGAAATKKGEFRLRPF